MSDDSGKQVKAPPKKRSPRRAAPKAPATPIEHSMQLMQLAVERGANPEEIRALMDMRRELQGEAAAVAFRDSKAQFLTALPIIKKQRVASFPGKNGVPVTYNYASLDDVVETIKPYLERFGFSYSWEQSVEQGLITVTCILTHKDGHKTRCSMQGMLDQSGAKNSIQQLGSTSTYLRRYTLTGVMGIATAEEDIDGRLPESPASRTLEGILLDGEEDAAVISDHIVAAGTIEELKIAGEMINDMVEGKYKERLKKEYCEALKILREAAHG